MKELEELAQTTDEDTPQNDISKYNRLEIIENMKSSVDFMAAICLPDVCTEFFPDIYQYLWKRYTEALLSEEPKQFPKFGLALPRGHGKTMFLKLLVTYCVLFTSRQFISVICASDERAEDITTDVESILDSPNVMSLFGNWRNAQERSKLGYIKFAFMGRKRILMGLGQDSAFRGMNIDNLRPDVMFFDDAQTAKIAESPATSMKFIRKFFGTMLKAKSPKRCVYLYVGNMYPNVAIERNPISGKTLYACLLRNLKDNPNWETLIVGGILENGEALWEEVQGIEQLLSEMVDDFYGGSIQVFASEVLNDPDFSLLDHFDSSKVPEFPFGELDIPTGRFMVVDPSLGKKDSDDQMLGVAEVFDGYPVLVELIKSQTSAPETAKTIIKTCMEQNIPLVAIESYAYQGTLIQWLQFWLTQMKVEGLQVVPITRGAETKNQSILNMFKEIMIGDIYLAEKVRGMVYDQILEFDPNSKDNRDDILDVVAYMNKVLVKYRNDLFIPLLSGDFDYDSQSSGVMDAGLTYGV